MMNRSRTPTVRGMEMVDSESPFQPRFSVLHDGVRLRGEPLGNRFPPNPFRNSFCRIPHGILILIVGTMDGNTFLIVWNLLCLS